MFQPIDGDPAPDRVRRITFVPFLADGRCVLIEDPGGPALPAGEVQAGEDYLLDTVLRVPRRRSAPSASPARARPAAVTVQAGLPFPPPG
jgi:hypothetical protein